MRHATITIGLVSFLALLYAAGCCQTPQGPAPAPTGGQPPLLGDRAVPPPPLFPEPRPLPQCTASVKGETVYNLGLGVISNTSSARVAGGAATPSEICVPGGVAVRCPNPLPQVYLDALRTGAAVPPAAPRVFTAPAPAASAWEPGLAATGYCTPSGVCVDPAARASAEVCPPGVDCFVLPATELPSGPELVIPAAVQTGPAPEWVPSPAPSAPSAPSAPLAPPAPEVKADDAGASTMPRIQATEAIPEIAIPTDEGAQSYQVVIPPAPAAPAAPTGTEGLRPMTPPPAPESGNSESLLPPLPQITPLTGDPEPLPAPEGLDTSALPEVTLPPSLN